MIRNYKLFENLEKAKKILADHKIPLTDPNFLKLKELLSKNLGYMGPFTKWYLIDREDFGKIEDTYKLLKNINIDKPIDSFEKLEDLYDYLQDFDINKKVNQIVAALPTHTRKYVNDELTNLLKLNTQWAAQIKKFYSDKGGRYNEQSRWWQKPTQFKTYSDWLIDVTKTLLKNLNGGFNAQKIKDKMEKENLTVKPIGSTDDRGNYDVEMVLDTPDLMMIKVNDFKASKALGSTHWCISQSQSYWNSYVTEFTNQYFFFDFSKDISDIKHMIGATIAPGGRISYAHFADDSPVRDMSYFDEL